MPDNTAQLQLALSPHYHSAANAITQPDRMVFLSRYLVEKWLPDLGGDGLAILMFLRKRCFYNRRTGEKRETVTVSINEIAAGCRISKNTVRRQLQSSIALKAFVSVQEEYVVEGRRGGVLQSSNTYTVLMDDPVHPSDLTRLEEELRRRETTETHEAGASIARARRQAEELRKERRNTSLQESELTPSQIGRAL